MSDDLTRPAYFREFHLPAKGRDGCPCADCDIGRILGRAHIDDDLTRTDRWLAGWVLWARNKRTPHNPSSGHVAVGNSVNRGDPNPWNENAVRCLEGD